MDGIKSIALSRRLSAVVSMVTKGGCVADVGCDHGFVSIYLIQHHIAERVIAMDVNEGPLARAREHVTAYELDAYIELRLSDGITLLKEEDRVETVILAGMGGKLMERIMSSGMERGLFIREYILQPQSDWGSLRKFLRDKEYTITDEDMVLEDGKFYPVIKVCYKGKPIDGVVYEKSITDAFGPLLLAQKNPVLEQYLQKEIKKFDTIVRGMERRGRVEEEVRRKRQFLEEAVACLKKEKE